MKNRGDTCCESSKMLFTKSNAVIKGARILSLIFTAFLFSVSYTVNCQNAIQGIAPVLYPPGGFGVDGDALANYVQPGLYANSGDWFSDTAYIGKGGTVFNMSTADPYDLNYPMAHHWLDGWMHGTDLTVFTLSDKINDNPNSYTWADGSAPNKNEINNATVQFSWGDPTLPGGNATDLWCSFAADRQVNTGSAYIDFEFLQKPLTMTGTSSGGFLSSGTDSGRTVGDILITIEFQQGGAAAFAVIQRWQPKTGGGFEYAEFTPDAGDIFCTSNLEVQIAPWEPYGQFQYDINQYAEGAVNLTKVFNIAQNPCMVLSTVFVRTRTSGSSGHSELKDFPGAPYQINLDMDDLAITCPQAVNLTACTSQADVTTAYDTWKSGFSYTGGIAPVTTNIANFPALPGNFACTGGTLSFSYIVSDFCEKTDTCTSTFDVTQPAALVINCPALANLSGCTSQTAIDTAYDAWVAGFTFSGDCNATSNIASIPALPANAHCNGASISFTFTASGDCDSDTCSSTFDVAQPAALVINCPAPVNLVGCTSQTAIQDAYDDWVAGFTFSGDCNATSNIASIPALPANAHCNGASLSFTFTASGDCDSDTCSSTFDVAQPAALVVNCPDSVSLPCIPLANILVAYDNWKAGFTFSGDCNVTDNMADFPPMDIDPILGGTLSFTYNVKGDCDQIECTSEFTVAPCGGHIFPTQTSCCNYLTGTPELENVCYKPDVGMVGNAIPGVFFYYTKIIAPSEAFTINVVQTKDCSNFNYFAVHQGNQILLFNDDCERLITVIPSESSTGQAHLVVNGATAGATYVLSVKYNVKSIIGSTYTGQPPTCDYHFVTNIGGIDITNSGGHINVVPGCSDNTPLPEECSLLPFNPASTITPLNEETMLNIYPNPFSNSAEITFASDNNETKVVLEVYDLLGNKVMKLYEGPTSADQPYTIAFNAGNNLGEGIYVLVLRTIHDVKTTRFVVNR